MRLRQSILHGLFFVVSCVAATAAVRVNGLFNSGMVLQRDVPAPVWGSADPGEAVTVTYRGQIAQTVAGADGRWRVTLPAFAAASTGATLTVQGTNTLSFTDVVVGDVFLCSGQSNMDYRMDALKANPLYAADLQGVNLPLIRQIVVPRSAVLDPQYEVAPGGRWIGAVGGNVNQFTAAGFYFARDLQPAIGVPVGLVLSAWGGTSAEAWTSLEAFATHPELQARAIEQRTRLANLPADIAAFPGLLATWESATQRNFAQPASIAPALPATSAAAWPVHAFNRRWRDMGLTNGGYAWMRRELTVDASAVGRDVRIDLGQVTEQDVWLYWNGTLLHHSGRTAPQFYTRYVPVTIPGSLMTAGTGVLAIRFRAPTGERVPITRDDLAIGLHRIQAAGLTNQWRVSVESTYRALTTAERSAMPVSPTAEGRLTATTLFNGMIHPILAQPFKGVFWYQGEQDASRHVAYRDLLPLMINDWRSRQGRPELPFLVQQLPNWKEAGANLLNYALQREAQALTAARLPEVHYSVAYDIGETNDVHPANKRDIGKRMALVARNRLYGQPVAWHGPRYLDATTGGGVVRLNYAAQGALRTRDGLPPGAVQIAGPDLVFQPAQAVIVGSSVVASHPNIPAPVAARYAFYNDPLPANLTDDTGLPASPARSDGGLFPLARWSFDDDSAGFFVGEGAPAAAVPATYAGAVYATPGITGESVSFTAAQPGTVTIAQNIGALTGGTFTLECWLRPTGDAADFGTILDIGGVSGLSLRLSPGRFLTLGFTGLPSAITSPERLPVQAWHHLAITATPQAVSLHLNGVLVGTRALAAPLALSTPLRIGAVSENGVLVRGLNGDVDELRLHPLVLSASQLRGLALVRTPTTAPAARLHTAEWRFGPAQLSPGGTTIAEALGRDSLALNGASLGFAAGATGGANALLFSGAQTNSARSQLLYNVGPQAAFRARFRPDAGGADRQTLLSVSGAYELRLINANTATPSLEFIVFTNDTRFRVVRAPYVPGQWNTVQALVDDRTVTLLLNDTLAETFIPAGVAVRNQATTVQLGLVGTRPYRGALDTLLIERR